MDQTRVRGGALLGALVSGVLAAGALTGGPTANATCASFFGIGNSADCTSGFGSIAVALGPNATATAQGILSAALAIGADAQALTNGNVNLSMAAGPKERAFSFGTLSTALALGVGVGSTYAWVQAGDSDSDVLNIAIGIGKDGAAWAGANLNNNSVGAGPGPVAIALSAFRSGAIVTKSEPGFNVNGCRVPNTAATSAVTAAAVDLGPDISTPGTTRAVNVSSLPARRGTVGVSARSAAASVSQGNDSVQAGQQVAGGHETVPTGGHGRARGRP